MRTWIEPSWQSGFEEIWSVTFPKGLSRAVLSRLTAQFLWGLAGSPHCSGRPSSPGLSSQFGLMLASCDTALTPNCHLKLVLFSAHSSLFWVSSSNAVFSFLFYLNLTVYWECWIPSTLSNTDALPPIFPPPTVDGMGKSSSLLLCSFQTFLLFSE